MIPSWSRPEECRWRLEQIRRLVEIREKASPFTLGTSAEQVAGALLRRVGASEEEEEYSGPPVAAT
jgi:hypothetical protein